MTRSFSSLCVTNAICLTGIWILVALGICVTKMQKDQEKQDVYDFFSKTNLTILKNDTEINLPSYYLPAQSLSTISKSLIWIGIVLDFVVCFTEFMVVWLKVQAPPAGFYWLSVGRYLTYIFSECYHYLISQYDTTWEFITFQLAIWTLCRIIQGCYMFCMNKGFSNEIAGINNPVYAVGPTGIKAMAGA